MPKALFIPASRRRADVHRMTDPSPSADGAAVSATSWFGIELTQVYGDVLSGIVRQTRCSQAALDVLHDALVRYAVAASLRPVSTPQAYLRRIVRNVLADRYRIESRYVPLFQDEPDETASTRSIAGQVPAQPSAETVADLRQRLERLQSVIAPLPRGLLAAAGRGPDPRGNRHAPGHRP